SPFTMLKSWGSSSSLHRRRRAPNGNTRGSWFAVIGLANSACVTFIVRNLYIVKTAPPSPARLARKSTGPGLDSLIPMAASANTGLRAITAISATAMSTTRLTMSDDSPDGHEHLGCLQTGLIAPGFRAIAERLE